MFVCSSPIISMSGLKSGRTRMPREFWQYLVSSYRQGTVHEVFFKDGATEAQWFLAILTLLLALVTFLLVTDRWRKGKEQSERWDRDERQRDKDRAEERE